MNTDLLSNALFSALWGTLTVVALVSVLFCGAWWHLFSGAICLIMFWSTYTDKAYTEISVRDWVRVHLIKR